MAYIRDYIIINILSPPFPPSHPHTLPPPHSIKCLVWLVEQGGGDTYLSAVDGMGPVHAAAQAGHIPCLQWLVEVGGVPIRHKAEDGATPAHFAAASGQVSNHGNK